jgi:RNA recognition motif-containing protein
MRLYVRNIPWDETNQTLATHFREKGLHVITVNVVKDQETGQSKGFAYVEVQNYQSRMAIDTMNGSRLGGRVLFVDIAKPRSVLAKV